MIVVPVESRGTLVGTAGPFSSAARRLAGARVHKSKAAVMPKCCRFMGVLEMKIRSIETDRAARDGFAWSR
jgi:hypothetical protein